MVGGDVRFGYRSISSCKRDFLRSKFAKIIEGGRMPLAVGACLLWVMMTWRTGARILSEKSQKEEVPLAQLVANLEVPVGLLRSEEKRGLAMDYCSASTTGHISWFIKS